MEPYSREERRAFRTMTPGQMIYAMGNTGPMRLITERRMQFEEAEALANMTREQMSYELQNLINMFDTLNDDYNAILTVIEEKGITHDSKRDEQTFQDSLYLINRENTEALLAIQEVEKLANAPAINGIKFALQANIANQTLEQLKLDLQAMGRFVLRKWYLDTKEAL